MFAALRRRLRGQSGSEYMMVISVVTIAVVGAAYAFVPQFRDGTTNLGNEVRDILGTGTARGAGGTGGGADAGGNGGADNTGGAESATSDPGLGQPADPGGSTANSGAGGGGNGGGANRADTRYQRNNQSCFLGICFGTRETAIGGGTGGGGGETTVAQGQAAELGSDSDKINGAWKSFFQGDVSKAASAASDKLKENPICGPSIIAALTGRSVDDVYSELENNGRLALVKKETVVAGVTVSSSYTTTGVMSQNQLALALREDYGFRVSDSTGAGIRDVQNALDKGKTPIVLISDSRDGSSNAGDFGVVTDIVPGMGVKIDSSTGSYWIPQNEFERRMEVMGGRIVTASPPSNRNNTVATGP
jgi:hypothetical protein